MEFRAHAEVIIGHDYNSRCHSKVISEGLHPYGMEFLQIRIYSCASLVVSCVTPLTTCLEDCLPSKLSKE